MKPDAILFDFDGVLVDSVHIKERAFGELYQEFGQEVMDDVKKHHRENGGVSRFDKFCHYHQAFLGKTLTSNELDTLNRKFSKLVTQLVIQANEIPGVRSMLNALYSAVPLHVVSATPEEELSHIISERKMGHFFRSTHGSPKKKSEHISKIAADYKYEKKKIVLVGDTTSDYQASADAGVLFLGYVPIQNENTFSKNTPVFSNMDVCFENIKLVLGYA